MYFHFTLFKNIPAGKAKRKAGLRKNKSLPLGPFIRGKIRRVLHTTRTVPFTIYNYTSMSYLRREQLVSMVRVLFLLLGTLRNYDGDCKENVKKTIGWMSKTTTLHVHHSFCTFLCCACTTTTWNDHTLSLLVYGKDKAINSTISVWTRARPPLFSSNQNSLLLSNSANWDNRENV